LSRLGAVLAAAVLFGAVIVAQSSPQSGRVSLFNGKDLTG